MKKARIWDSKLLADTYVIAAQIQFQIDQLMAEMPNTNLNEVPHSLIPTRNLY